MKKRYLTIIIALLSAAVALTAGALVLFLNTPKGLSPSEESEPTEAAESAVTITEAPHIKTASETPTELPTEELTEEPTEELTETPTEAFASVPEEMNRILSQNGSTVSDLSNRGCRQLVTVVTAGSSAQIHFYSLSDDRWTEDESLSCYGYVGRNGATWDMHEGGMASPKGLYAVGEAFYIYDRPETGLQTFEVTNDTYWVDDPDSAFYNRRVEGTAEQDWNSAEHMIDYSTAYEYGFVVEYNTQQEYNKGSAIFFHVSSGPTAGCIGTDRSSVLSYLRKLDAAESPYIIIV